MTEGIDGWSSRLKGKAEVFGKEIHVLLIL